MNSVYQGQKHCKHFVSVFRLLRKSANQQILESWNQQILMFEKFAQYQR